MKIEIEKVENGFLITKKYLSAKQPEPFLMTTSYRVPMEEVCSKIVFEKWNDLQLYIRKQFGVAE